MDAFAAFLLDQAKAATFVGVLAFVLLVLFFVLFWRAQHSDSPIDVADWFLDTGTNRVTRRALGELVFLFVSVVVAFYLLTTESDLYTGDMRIYAILFLTVLWVARSLLGPIVQVIASKFGGGGGGAAPGDEDNPVPTTTRTRKQRTTRVTATAEVETPPPAATAGKVAAE
jgi:hypothetical protein